MIRRCACNSEYQDIKYGKFMRVFNPLPSLKSGPKWRCSVCQKEQ